ncbi:MAG: tetratricopeptide repeat protein [Bacteroidales bacterium]|nr:tetratricopeptide repeat protein [Bacteroidales bacterium]MDE6237878.1 tetratricopeptide repeat protein [Muribaculaceae bacterium]MDE6536424.1 tetratricopeptide repeat protein [Muribaculaceae bacterium]
MASNNENEQNAIDKLNENLSNASERIANNKKIIYWAVGIILVAGVFALSYFFIYRNPHLKGAAEAYNQVEVTAAGNDSVAAAEYKKVADQYSNTPSGHLAALEAAESFYDQGKYKDALACLDKAKISEPVLNANAIILKGDCYVNLKQYDKALDAYKEAAKKGDKNEQIVPRALLKAANVYDEQKKYGEALKCYEEIKNDYPLFRLGTTSVDAYIEREKARLGK